MGRACTRGVWGFTGVEECEECEECEAGACARGCVRGWHPALCFSQCKQRLGMCTYTLSSKVPCVCDKFAERNHRNITPTIGV